MSRVEKGSALAHARLTKGVILTSHNITFAKLSIENSGENKFLQIGFNDEFDDN